mgnify:CR=1 FL=1
MRNFKKDFKRLCVCYDKKLRKCHKDSFNALNNNMEYFITYLKYLRDYYILTDQLTTENGENDIKVTSLIAAISEYEKSQSCINNYYKPDGTRLTDEDEKEVLEKYNKEKAFHWSHFWQLVMLNIESWTANA